MYVGIYVGVYLRRHHMCALEDGMTSNARLRNKNYTPKL